MSDTPIGHSSITGNAEYTVKEVTHKTSYNSNGYKDKDLEDKMKKFENAKSISSDMFYETDKKQDDLNIRKFNDANAISSAQVFGYEEEEESNTNGSDLCNLIFNIDF